MIVAWEDIRRLHNEDIFAIRRGQSGLDCLAVVSLRRDRRRVPSGRSTHARWLSQSEHCDSGTKLMSVAQTQAQAARLLSIARRICVHGSWFMLTYVAAGVSTTLHPGRCTTRPNGKGCYDKVTRVVVYRRALRSGCRHRMQQVDSHESRHPDDREGHWQLGRVE